MTFQKQIVKEVQNGFRPQIAQHRGGQAPLKEPPVTLEYYRKTFRTLMHSIFRGFISIGLLPHRLQPPSIRWSAPRRVLPSQIPRIHPPARPLQLRRKHVCNRLRIPPQMNVSWVDTAVSFMQWSLHWMTLNGVPHTPDLAFVLPVAER